MGMDTAGLTGSRETGLKASEVDLGMSLNNQ